MTKMCRFRRARCYRASCSFIDSMGNVGVCELHPNPNGFLMRRRVVPVVRSIWNKHTGGF